MEMLDLLYLIKKRYDRSHKKFLFFRDDNRDLYKTAHGICHCLDMILLDLYLDLYPRYIDKWPTLHFLYECYLERGGGRKFGKFWFYTGELGKRRRLINYAIKKLKNGNVG